MGGHAAPRIGRRSPSSTTRHERICAPDLSSASRISSSILCHPESSEYRLGLLRYPNPVNENAARLIAGGVLMLSLAILATGNGLTAGILALAAGTAPLFGGYNLLAAEKLASSWVEASVGVLLAWAIGRELDPDRSFTALDRRCRKESSREVAHHRSSCPRRGDGARNSHHGARRRRGVRVRDGECRHRRCLGG